MKQMTKNYQLENGVSLFLNISDEAPDFAILTQTDGTK